jgi:hypothetical protein
VPPRLGFQIQTMLPLKLAGSSQWGLRIPTHRPGDHAERSQAAVLIFGVRQDLAAKSAFTSQVK